MTPEVASIAIAIFVAGGQKNKANVLTTTQSTMGGKVELKRGESVIRGEKLVIDLPGGQSRIIGGPGGDGARVKGVFIPAKKQQGSGP